MIDEYARDHLKFWSERLGIRRKIEFKRVPRSYWGGNNGRHIWGSSEGYIFYSKNPSEETIVHELAHLRWPHLDEKTIREITKSLIW